MDKNGDKQLLVELNKLRAEGLRQMDGWQSEKQETGRLKAIVTRFKHQIEALEEQVVQLRENFNSETQRADRAQLKIQLFQARLAELKEALTQFGQHARGCPKYKKPKAEECTCGLAAFSKPEE